MWLIELMMCTNWNLITASSWPIVHVVPIVYLEMNLSEMNRR